MEYASVIDPALQFNPKYRTSVAKLLKIPYFDDLRNDEMEKPASKFVYVTDLNSKMSKEEVLNCFLSELE